MHSGASDDSLLPPTPSDDRTPCEGDARGHRDRGALHPDVPAELTHRRHHPGYVASPRGGGQEERRQKANMYEASASGWPQTDGSSGMQVSGRVMAIVIAATHVSTRPARTQTCSRRCRTHRLTSIPDGANLTGSDSPRSGPRDSAGGVPQPGVLSPDRCVSPATCGDSGGVPQGGGEGTEGSPSIPPRSHQAKRLGKLPSRWASPEPSTSPRTPQDR